MLKRLIHSLSNLSGLRTIVVIIAIVFAVAVYQQRDMVKGVAPSICSELISGEFFNTEKALMQGPVLVYFWGSWCPVCSLVSPSVDSVAEDYTVLSVALSSGSDDDISLYLKKHGYQFKTLNDQHGIYAQQWGVKVTPSIFIIDQRGNIVFVTTGVSTSWGLKLRLWLAGLGV
jgi:peroxiredoxin